MRQVIPYAPAQGHAPEWLRSVRGLRVDLSPVINPRLKRPTGRQGHIYQRTRSSAWRNEKGLFAAGLDVAGWH